MKNIEVKICSGTTCFVMGSSYLNDLFDIIPKKYGNIVNIKQSLCLGQCSKTDNHSKAPYVQIDDEYVSEANIEKVLKVIERKLN